MVTAHDAERDLIADDGATRKAIRETRRVLVKVLERGIETGEFREDLDTGAAARNLQAVLLGLQRNHASARPVVSIERRRDLDALVEAPICRPDLLCETEAIVVLPVAGPKASGRGE